MLIEILPFEWILNCALHTNATQQNAIVAKIFNFIITNILISIFIIQTNQQQKFLLLRYVENLFQYCIHHYQSLLYNINFLSQVQ